MRSWFLTQESYKGGRKLSEDEPMGSPYVRLTHDCPFCGKRGSKDRALVWIVESCIASGKALFPCWDCGEYMTFPSEVFKEGLLESLRITEPNGRVGVSHGRLGEKKPSEIFIKDWFQVLLTANKGGPVDLDHIAWDGKGTCPGCGKAETVAVSQSLDCVSCRHRFWINQDEINKMEETPVGCPKCNSEMIIPPTVWCPKCGQNLRHSNFVLKLFKEANQDEKRKKVSVKGSVPMVNIDHGRLFEEALRDEEFEENIRIYKTKIDYKAFHMIAMSVFEAVVEGKPAEEVGAKFTKDIVPYIAPTGKMTIPEFQDLLQSLGKVFLRYLQKKREYIKLAESNKSTKMSPSIDSEQSTRCEKKGERKSRKWWQFYR